MKKKLFIVVCALLGVLAASAQQKLVIKLENGKRLTYETWQVDSLYFTAGETADIPDPTDPVDLGFAKWSMYNFGATTESETGLLVGWGDETGTNHSMKLKYFPGENYSKSINETPYDIVCTRWGSEWRLPTTEDIQMLKDSCTWTYEVKNEVPGWRLTSKKAGYTNQSIFLPFTGYRKGEDTISIATAARGLYWTGIIGDDTQKAKAMLLTGTDTDTLTVVDSLRYMGFAIRPVYGKIVHPLQFTSVTETVSERQPNSVQIVAKVIGDMTNVNKIYICFDYKNHALNPLSPDAANKREVAVEENKTTFEFNISGLDANTQYKGIVFLSHDNSYVFSDTIFFQTSSKFPVAEAVNLGLSVDWASWNMGESTPSGNTHRYGWGDSDGELTTEVESAYAPNLSLSTTSIAGQWAYDIARKQWGEGWRLPTLAEFRELYDDTKINYNSETVSGVSGMRFTSKSDPTKTIFIPGCGMVWPGNGTLQFPGSAYYWTANASYASNTSWMARVAYLIPGLLDEASIYPKPMHLPIRPVKANNNQNTSGNTGGNTGGDSGNTGGNTGGDSGNTGGNSGGGNTTPALSNQAGQPVDLGLPSGKLWADRNVGASGSTGYGGYYAWGDVTAHTDNFGVDDYQYYNPDTQTYVDIAGVISGNANYDAATKNWGGKWRMPTKDEMEELVAYCKWTWTSKNGVNGYEVKGSNNNTIFLPACGSYDKYSSGTVLEGLGVSGYYWSGTVYSQTAARNYAYYLMFESNYKSTAWIGRNLGCCIRPIQDKP